MCQHQASGMPVQGSLTWDKENIEFNKDNSFASMDWTRSFASRQTIWVKNIYKNKYINMFAFFFFQTSQE